MTIMPCYSYLHNRIEIQNIPSWIVHDGLGKSNVVWTTVSTCKAILRKIQNDYLKKQLKIVVISWNAGSMLIIKSTLLKDKVLYWT